MQNSRVAPKVVLWWGIGLTVAGTVLIILLPNLAYGFGGGGGAVGVDQGLMLAIDLIVRILGGIVAPLGVALIGASIVMVYLRQLLRPTLGAIVSERSERVRRES